MSYSKTSMRYPARLVRCIQRQPFYGNKIYGSKFIKYCAKVMDAVLFSGDCTTFEDELKTKKLTRDEQLSDAVEAKIFSILGDKKYNPASIRDLLRKIEEFALSTMPPPGQAVGVYLVLLNAFGTKCIQAAELHTTEEEAQVFVQALMFGTKILGQLLNAGRVSTQAFCDLYKSMKWDLSAELVYHLTAKTQQLLGPVPGFEKCSISAIIKNLCFDVLMEIFNNLEFCKLEKDSVTFEDLETKWNAIKYLFAGNIEEEGEEQPRMEESREGQLDLHEYEGDFDFDEGDQFHKAVATLRQNAMSTEMKYILKSFLRPGNENEVLDCAFAFDMNTTARPRVDEDLMEIALANPTCFNESEFVPYEFQTPGDLRLVKLDDLQAYDVMDDEEETFYQPEPAKSTSLLALPNDVHQEDYFAAREKSIERQLKAVDRYNKDVSQRQYEVQFKEEDVAKREKKVAEREALQKRIEELEQELAETEALKEENEKLAKKVDELEAEHDDNLGSPAPKRKKASSSRAESVSSTATSSQKPTSSQKSGRTRKVAQKGPETKYPEFPPKPDGNGFVDMEPNEGFIVTPKNAQPDKYFASCANKECHHSNHAKGRKTWKGYFHIPRQYDSRVLGGVFDASNCYWWCSRKCQNRAPAPKCPDYVRWLPKKPWIRPDGTDQYRLHS